MRSSQPTRSARPSRPCRGFSLIELLVVLIVIALIIAIILPALGAVRDTARGTATKGLLNNVLQASTTFQGDNRRLPGYFSPRDMGAAENEGRGMSAMQNIMIDLMAVPVATSSGTGLVEVGPLSASAVYVNPTVLGAQGTGSKNYLTVDGKYLVAQTENAGQQVASVTGHKEFPSLVDDFGTPVLAWVADDTAVGDIRNANDFARQNSGAGTARFYWASNAAFLNATTSGTKSTNQLYSAAEACSLIGGGAPSLGESLMGVLGNPSYPRRDPNDPNAVPTVAAAARGPMILQSAGSDGYYFGSEDSGAKQFDGPPMVYSRNFANVSGQIYMEDGNPKPEDIVQQFDDSLMAGGN